MKSRGRHKIRGVWQQLNPLIRNRPLFLLSAEGQAKSNHKAQKAVPEMERWRGIFFPHYIQKLLTFIHWRLCPSWPSHPITDFTCCSFSDSTKIHPNSVTSLSIPSCSAQNTTESTIHEFQSCLAFSLCNFSCILGIAALKGFLMSLPTTSQGAHSSESFRSTALLEKKSAIISAHTLNYSIPFTVSSEENKKPGLICLLLLILNLNAI